MRGEVRRYPGADGRLAGADGRQGRQHSRGAGWGRKPLAQGLGSLDAIYADLDAVAGVAVREGKSRREARGATRAGLLSRELATIRTDVPLGSGRPMRCTIANPIARRWANGTAISSSTAGSRSWQAGAESAATTASRRPEANYETVLDRKALDRWVATLAVGTAVCGGYRDHGLDYMRARVVGVSLAVEPGHAAYIPFGHDYLGAPEQLDAREVLALRPLLEAETPQRSGRT